MTKYNTIYADPPWSEVGGGKIKRGADAHYSLMSTKEILAMADFVKDISNPDCHCYLWVTNNFLLDGLKVLERWGFEYKTMITWMKDRFGLGQYFRGITEHCLFGVRGVLPYKLLDGKRQQGTTGFVAKRQQHSEKPEEMRQLIEKVSYAPYIELFARKQVQGWDVWGNEVGLTLPIIKSIEDVQDGNQVRGCKAGVSLPTSHPHENPPRSIESWQSFLFGKKEASHVQPL